VIGDRHDLSTQAYQGGGRGIDQTMLATLRDAYWAIFARPDAVSGCDAGSGPQTRPRAANWIALNKSP
jgi:hypothetical protein